MSGTSLPADEAGVPLIELSRLRDGHTHKFYVQDRAVLLFRDGDDVTAYKGYCPHQGMELMESGFEGKVVTCAFHLWRFAMPGGRCGPGGNWDLAPLRAEVVDGWVTVWSRA